MAVELQALRQSDNPDQRSLADVLAAVADLRTAIAAIDKRLSDPTAVLPTEYVRNAARTMHDLDVLRYWANRNMTAQPITEVDLDKIRERIRGFSDRERERIKEEIARLTDPEKASRESTDSTDGP